MWDVRVKWLGSEVGAGGGCGMHGGATVGQFFFYKCWGCVGELGVGGV